MADIETESTKNKTYKDIPGLHPWLLDQLKQLRIEQPTPIQYHCIPPALENRDVIGAAKTGSGKTLAFVIPILQKLSVDPYGIFALILTPTRELAFQIGDQFRGVGTPMSLRVSVIVGGLDKVTQGGELSKGPHIVVATPGRLDDILTTSPQFTLKRIKFLVLDEADRLMDGKFDRQLRSIWSALPEKRQTLMFSATITDRLNRMKELASSKVFLWESSSSNDCNYTSTTVAQLVQNYCLVSTIVKDATLISIILQYREDKPDKLILIFTEECRDTQVLRMTLNDLGIESVMLHGMMPQKERLSSLSQFKSSHVKILVATDVASRGLDIPMVGLVLNHRIPNIPKTYIHRVGRTARAGRDGQAITLITPDEVNLLLAVEAVTGKKMEQYKVDNEVVKKIMKQVNTTKREQEIKLEETNFDERRNTNKRKRLIMQGKDPEREEKRRLRLLKNKRKQEAKQKESVIESTKISSTDNKT